jgi:chemotaxis signal transduction protein
MTQRPDAGTRIETRTDRLALEEEHRTELHIEAVWRERANRLSRHASVESEGDALQIIVVGVGKEHYGVRLADVLEVLAPVRPTPVPGGAIAIAGVINVHGEIRPVLDLRRVLGLDTILDANPPRMILLRKSGREIGVQIDSIEQIRRIDLEELEPRASDDASLSRHIEASTKDLLMLLSTDALFAELDFGANTAELH